MWQDYEIETARDKGEVAAFLGRFGLQYDSDSEVTVVVRQNGCVVATGSLRGSVLQCFAVDPGFQGTGLSGKIVDYLTQVAFDRGHTRLFVFTTPGNVRFFRGLMFRLLAETHWAALLESGIPSVEDYTRALASHAVKTSGTVGGLVMNCNPFTLGHQYLVERAASSCGHVYLLVVEEDRSAFPYPVRLELVKRGTARFSNVTVLPSGPYSVSLATFPSYFSAEETAHAQAGASIDATVYAKYVAGTLGIRQRFVGTEPYSPVTAIYNATMRKVLAEYGIGLVEIPRLEVGGKVVSASTVREALRADDYPLLATLVPETTLEFLTSREASGIISKLKANKGRH